MMLYINHHFTYITYSLSHMLCLTEKFMRDNIVGTVLILSLVIWIPLVRLFQSFVSIIMAYFIVQYTRRPENAANLFYGL